MVLGWFFQLLCWWSFCREVMPPVELPRTTAEMSTHQAGGSTESSGASLRCHMTFPLRLRRFFCIAMPSPRSLLESSAAWLNALISDWITIRSHPSQWGASLDSCLWRHWIWIAMPSPPSLLESSATWRNALPLAWVTIRLLLFWKQPSREWCHWKIFISGEIEFPLLHKLYFLDSATFSYFPLVPTKFQTLRKAHLTTSSHWKHCSCTTTASQPWALMSLSTCPAHFCWTSLTDPLTGTGGTAPPSAGWNMRSSMELSPGMVDGFPDVLMVGTGHRFNVEMQVMIKFWSSLVQFVWSKHGWLCLSCSVHRWMSLWMKSVVFCCGRKSCIFYPSNCRLLLAWFAALQKAFVNSGDCPEPGGVRFSTRTRYNGPYNSGSQVRYNCYDGSSRTITCQSSGAWTQKPRCTGGWFCSYSEETFVLFLLVCPFCVLPNGHLILGTKCGFEYWTHWETYFADAPFPTTTPVPAVTPPPTTTTSAPTTNSPEPTGGTGESLSTVLVLLQFRLFHVSICHLTCCSVYSTSNNTFSLNHNNITWTFWWDWWVFGISVILLQFRQMVHLCLSAMTLLLLFFVIIWFGYFHKRTILKLTAQLKKCQSVGCDTTYSSMMPPFFNGLSSHQIWSHFGLELDLEFPW